MHFKTLSSTRWSPWPIHSMSPWFHALHYSDVIMGMMASRITSLTIVYSTVYSGADQRKHQSSTSLAFVRGIYQWPANSPHQWPMTRKMFPFYDVISMWPWFHALVRLCLLVPTCCWCDECPLRSVRSYQSAWTRLGPAPKVRQDTTMESTSWA